MSRRPVEGVLVCSRLAAAREPSARQRRTAASNAATAIANRIVNRSISPRRLDLTSQTARTSSCALPRVRAQGGIVTSEARTLKPRREALLWRRGRGSHEPRPDNGITIVVRERVHQSVKHIAPVMARSRSAISRESRRTATSRGWMSHTADRTSAARRAPPRKGKQGVGPGLREYVGVSLKNRCAAQQVTSRLIVDSLAAPEMRIGPETIHQASTSTRGRTSTRPQPPVAPRAIGATPPPTAGFPAAPVRRSRDRHRGRVGRCDARRALQPLPADGPPGLRTQRRCGPLQPDRHRPRGLLRRPDGPLTGTPQPSGGLNRPGSRDDPAVTLAERSPHPPSAEHSRLADPPPRSSARGGVGQLDGAEPDDRRREQEPPRGCSGPGRFRC